MSEPVHIKEVLPGVLTEIQQRIRDRHRDEHQHCILRAIGDYQAGRKRFPPPTSPKSAPPLLFDMTRGRSR